MKDKFGIRFREIDYKDNPVFKDEVEKNEFVVIIDFSFKPDKMQELFSITPPNKVIWIDHHETAQNYDYCDKGDAPVELQGLRDFSKECKKAGCELAWEYFFPNEQMPEAVKLLGDYDTWSFKFGERTNCFQLGVKSCNTNPESPMWNDLFAGSWVDRVINDGLSIKRYRDNFCQNYRNHCAYKTKFEGYNFLAMNLFQMGSKAFGLEFAEYDGVLAFVWDGEQWTVSLYSQKIDVSKIALKYNGGGHKGAAGFVCKELPFVKA